MTTRSVVHASFTITRSWPQPPSKVVNAFADEQAKAKWFGGPPGWEQHEKKWDFREGGQEILSGRHPNGMVSHFDCLYRDGEVLIDHPAGERFAALSAAVGGGMLIPRIVTASRDAADRFLDEATRHGHEGSLLPPTGPRPKGPGTSWTDFGHPWGPAFCWSWP